MKLERDLNKKIDVLSISPVAMNLIKKVCSGMKKCNECIKNVFILSVRFRFLLFVLHLIMILKFAYLEPILTTLEM